MPFKSVAQERFMYSQHPDIAKRWQKETPNQSKLPNYSHLDSYFEGGKVPGIPEVPVDSPKNDKVKARLTPGEVVLPLSVTSKPDAPERAKQFMKLHQYFGE